MSKIWNDYPDNYRENEVQFLVNASLAGECASVIGLSGAGKSNLAGFLVHRAFAGEMCALVDCNRLGEISPNAFYHLVRQSMGDKTTSDDEYAALEDALAERLRSVPQRYCLVIDRFDALSENIYKQLRSGMRALRDTFKYQLSYIITSRRPLDQADELSELFYAHSIWLGPLAETDCLWTIEHFMQRKGLNWAEKTRRSIMAISGGYPSFVRCVCEAHADGCSLNLQDILNHPAVKRRLGEFWNEHPGVDALKYSGLEGIPLLQVIESKPLPEMELTAKEALLLAYFQKHPDEICGKDDLIRAVWPEDKVFLEGIRDDSLAQLVRRLRKKIEPDPMKPIYIHSVIGRGYKYIPDRK